MTNSLVQDFENFISHRMYFLAERLRCNFIHNSAKKTLNDYLVMFEDTLSDEQKQAFNEISDFETNITSIIEENAYRAGFKDALLILVGLV